MELSATIQELFEPIEISAWTDVSVPFDGVTSFRDPGDPFKRFRAVENAYSRFEVLLLQARSKRQTLKSQIARLNFQLKNAKDDAEVQKLAGSLQAAQTALIDLDDMVDTSRQQMESLQVLNENRKEQEEVAADQISRERNQELAAPAPIGESYENPFNPAQVADQTAADSFTVTDSVQGTISHHSGNIYTPHAAQAAFNSHSSRAQQAPPPLPRSNPV